MASRPQGVRSPEPGDTATNDEDIEVDVSFHGNAGGARSAIGSIATLRKSPRIVPVWIRLYTLLWVCALPFVLLRLWWRGRREPAYSASPGERFGAVTRRSAGGVWLHAVSAGEMAASARLRAVLAERFPDRPLIVTTTTPTGRARAQADGNDAAWLPFDVPFFLDRFLTRTRPCVLLLVERELWPGLVWCARAAGVPVVLVSGRLGAGSAARYARVPGLRSVLFESLALALCEDAASAGRLRELGVPKVHVTGSLKAEPLVPEGFPAQVAAHRRALDGGFVIVAGSVHPPELDALLAAFVAHRRPHWRLVLVPRHPQRFADAHEACVASGLAFRRAESMQGHDVPLVLWDRMGDLFALYGAADVAFVGGSLVPVGGHTPSEPAWHGVPVVMGPHMEQTGPVAAALTKAGALIVVKNGAEVFAQCARWEDDAGLRRRAGGAARLVLHAEEGAVAKTADAIAGVVQSPA